MSVLGNNIYNLRKGRGWTQAELADKLGVTNQAVSKWETGDSLPDSALLVPISELFGVSIDELMKGDFSNGGAENKPQENTEKEVRELKNLKPQEWRGKFIAFMCAGLALVFAAIIEIVLVGIIDESFALYGIMIMMALFAIGVPLFVYAGIIDSMYYLDVKSDEWKPLIKKFARGIAVGVSLCIIGVTGFIFCGLSEIYPESETLILCIGMAGGFVIIAAAVTLFVAYGLKFDAGVKRIMPEYTRMQRENHMGVGRFGGVVMLIATAIFLALGFLFKLWHPGWVVFPIGGIICAILSSIYNATGKGDKDE